MRHRTGRAGVLNELSESDAHTRPRLLGRTLFARETLMLRVLAFVLFLPFAAHAADSGDAETLKHLPQSKHTLVDGIRQAEQANGSAISAKFEFEDGKFWLSVYTAKDGRARDAEHNTLIELKGAANAAAWKPDTEVFEDKKHLTRSATQLSLMQLSKLSLADIVGKASSGQAGTPYSAIPAIKEGKPVVVVLFALPDGKTNAVNVDLR